MPRNGSGTFSRSNGDNTGASLWQNDRDDGDKIRADRHDTHDQDIATALTASLAKDGQTTPTANLPMGGYCHTNVGEATARTNYARASQVQDSAFVYGGNTAGNSTTYTATITPATIAYTAGQRFIFLVDETNTGAVTLNVNSLGAKAIKLSDGATDLPAGMLIAGDVMEVIYDGTNFILLSPQIGPWTTWTPTVTAEADMAVSALSIDHARYRLEGDAVAFSTRLDFTLGGDQSRAVYFTLPIAPGQTRVAFAGHALGSGPGVAVFWDGSVSKVVVKLYDYSYWNCAPTASRLYISGKYEL